MLWISQVWLEGPHSIARAPSIKRALLADAIAEYDGTMDVFPDTPGFWTVHLRAIHKSGITMPFQHYTVETT
jgi:hypothetical protein